MLGLLGRGKELTIVLVRERGVRKTVEEACYWLMTRTIAANQVLQSRFATCRFPVFLNMHAKQMNCN